jgi:HAD superfamily hydrolase (TIGR01509 family)
MTNVELVLCDVGNVLVRADINITFRILEEAGVEPERARTFYCNEDFANFSRGLLSGTDAYRRLISLHLDCALSYQDLVHAHDQHIYEVDRGTEAVLKCIHTPLAFVTDTNIWQNAHVRKLIDLHEFSDLIVCSNDPDIQALKTDPWAWERILARLGVPPNRILFVDDSPSKIVQAQAAGVTHTILFENAGQFQTDLKEFNLVR